MTLRAKYDPAGPFVARVAFSLAGQHYRPGELVDVTGLDPSFTRTMWRTLHVDVAPPAAVIAAPQAKVAPPQKRR